MLQEFISATKHSITLLSAALLSVALFGMSSVQAQEASSATDTDVRPQNGSAMRGIEKSDIRRVQTRVGDSDGDGLGDAAPVARQADLKKLADELVNSHDPVAAKVDAGNALNAASGNARAGDPIPGIDITVNQGAGRSSTQVGDASDPTTEPVPALDANPTL